jgi:hypothetical protein
MTYSTRNNNMLLLTLSADAQNHISSFLGTKDALEYSKTCKGIHCALNFRIIRNVNTITYQQKQHSYNINPNPTDNDDATDDDMMLCKELIPSSLPNIYMVGKHAMHSYRIRCSYKYSYDFYDDNQTFFIKNCSEEIIALFIVDCDNKNIVLKPPDPDANQSYFLCHNNQMDEDIGSFDHVANNEYCQEMKFHVDILVHGT